MNGKNMMAVDLQPADNEFMNVKALFLQSSGGSYKINSVSILFIYIKLIILIIFSQWITDPYGGFGNV